LLCERRQYGSKYAVGFTILRIDGKGVLGCIDRFAPFVLSRIERGQFGAGLRALRIELDGFLEGSDRLLDLPLSLEVATDEEVVRRVIRTFDSARTLRGGRLRHRQD